LFYQCHPSVRPFVRELITWTVELWDRWIRLSCYYNNI